MAEGTQHPITDAGRRLAEAVDSARQQGGEGRWMCVALRDGAWSGDIYDSRADAIRHNSEGAHAFLMIPPMRMPSAEATAWIELHRKVWDGGLRFTDPGTPVPIPDLGPTATLPRPGVRPSGLVIPTRAERRSRRAR